MATKTYMVASGADGNFGALVDGVDQTAASRTDGWTPGTKAAAQQSPFDAGTKQASTTFAATLQPASFLTGTTANAFKIPASLYGTFANAAWTFTFAVRSTVGTVQAGRMRMRVFRANADGSNPNEITGATQIGTTSAALSTSADVTTVVTWSPGATVSLSGEYLFFVLGWEVTTAGSSSTADVVIRTGQAAGGSRLVTPDFVSTAFPANPVSDNFNRANGALTSPWYGQVRAAQGDGLQVVSNQLKTVVAAAWDGVAYGSSRTDIEAYITFVTIGAATKSAQLILRRDQTTDSGYVVNVFIVNAANDNIDIYRRTSGTDVSLGGTDSSQNFANGDSFGVSVKGSTITIWRKPAAGSWQVVTTRSDTNIASGTVALYTNDSSWVFDDFGTGVAGAPPANAKIETLTDAFTSSVDKVTKWGNSTADAVWDSGSGGQVKLPCVSTYSALVTAAPFYDLTGSYMMAKCTPPASGTSSREYTMELRSSTTGTADRFIFYWQQGNLYIRRYLAGAVSGEKIVFLDTVNMAWWRIRESGGTVYFDTSPDASTWTNQLTTAPGFDITSVYAVFSCGYYGTEAAANGFVDSVNVPPPATQISASDTNGTTYEVTQLGVLPFPVAGIVDNFNRANQQPPGSNWLGSTRANGWQVVSNQLQNPASAWDGMYWNAPTLVDMEAYATLVAVGGGQLQLHVRRDPVADTGYYVSLVSNTLTIWRRVSGADVSLDPSDSSQTWGAGDALGIRVRGSTITVYRKPAGGSWTPIMSRADALVTAAGVSSLFTNDAGWILDDFASGATVAATTVSGSDTGAGSDPAPTVQSLVSSSDSGTISESTSLVIRQSVSSSDAGSAAEVSGSPRSFVSNTDSGVGVDVGSYQQGGTIVDSGTGSESGSIHVDHLVQDPIVRTYASLPLTFATYADIPANVDIYAHLPYAPVYPQALENADVRVFVTSADANGTVVESASIYSTSVDVGTAVETATVVAKITAPVDAGTASDESAAPVFKVTVTDTGTGVDAVVIRTAALDGFDNNGTVTEAATPRVFVPDVDAGVLANEIALLQARYTQTDASGPTTEIAVAEFVKLNVTDVNGTTTEAVSLRLYAFDTGTSVESQSLVAKITDTDAGIAGENAFPPGGVLPAFDVGVWTDVAVPTVQQATADVNGAVTETPVLKSQALDTDAGSAVDTSAVVVKITATDSGIGSEATDQRRLLVPVTDANGATTETQAAQYKQEGYDSNGPTTEFTAISRAIFVLADSGVATEVASVSIILQTIVTTDSGTALDAAGITQYKNDVDSNGLTNEYAYSSITIEASMTVNPVIETIWSIALSGFVDNVSGVEVYAVAKVQVSVTEAMAASETATVYVHAFPATSDGGTATDLGVLHAQPVVADVNKPTLEFAQGPIGVLPAFDVAHGLDSATMRARVASADGNGPTGESAIGGAYVLADGSGTISETQSVHVRVTSSDYNLPTVETSKTYEHAFKVADEDGYGSEHAVVKAKPPAVVEAGTGSEFVLLRVYLLGADTGRATEFFALKVKTFASDSGLGVDKSSTLVRLTVADSGISFDYERSLGVRSSDTATGFDYADLRALLRVFDYGTSLESEHRDPPLVLFTDQPGGDILSPAMGYIDNASAVGTASRPFIAKGTFRFPTRGRIVR